MKTKIEIFAAIICLFLAVGTLSAQKRYDTKVVISTKKSVYYWNESIVLKFRIENRDSIGPDIFYLAEWIKIRNSKGLRMSSFLHVDGIHKRMSPGEIRKFEVELLNNYGNRYLDMQYPNLYWPTGTYTIQVIHPNRGYFPLKSNILEIKIILPENEEVFELLLYREAMKIYKEDREEYVAKLNRLVDDYPNSVYAPQTLRRLELNFYFNQSSEDQRKSYHFSRTLIKDYPDSYQARLAILHITHNFNDIITVEDKIKHLMQCYNESSDSLTKARIEELLKEL